MKQNESALTSDGAHTHTTTYSTYFLRVWNDNESGDLRATVKDVRDGAQQHFASLDLLIDFLRNKE